MPKAVKFKVDAWWQEYPTRATKSPYTILHDGGSTAVQVNQEASGGQWNMLGEYDRRRANATARWST